MSKYWPLLCTIWIGFLTSCAAGKFNKAGSETSSTPGEQAAADSAATEESPAPIDSNPIGTTESTASNAPIANAEDKTALNECIKQWAKTPFTPEEIARPKVININDNVNNNAVIFTDDKKTDKPALMLVNFNISVGNNGELQFLNPKGWYCFNVKAKVINNFVITTACDTQTAIISKLAQNDKNFTISKQEPCPVVTP